MDMHCVVLGSVTTTVEEEAMEEEEAVEAM
jgi:hypothetical protein